MNSWRRPFGAINALASLQARLKSFHQPNWCTSALSVFSRTSFAAVFQDTAELNLCKRAWTPAQAGLRGDVWPPALAASLKSQRHKAPDPGALAAALRGVLNSPISTAGLRNAPISAAGLRNALAPLTSLAIFQEVLAAQLEPAKQLAKLSQEWHCVSLSSELSKVDLAPNWGAAQNMQVQLHIWSGLAPVFESQPMIHQAISLTWPRHPVGAMRRVVDTPDLGSLWTRFDPLVDTGIMRLRYCLEPLSRSAAQQLHEIKMKRVAALHRVALAIDLAFNPLKLVKAPRASFQEALHALPRLFSRIEAALGELGLDAATFTAVVKPFNRLLTRLLASLNSSLPRITPVPRWTGAGLLTAVQPCAP